MSAWHIEPAGVVAVDHVQVAAPPGCEDEARSFYGDLLGLKEMEKPAALAARGGCWFRVGAQELHVGVAERFVPASKAHPGLLVATPDALRELAQRLEGAGVEVEWAAESEIPGRVRFHVRDPFGNRLELLADD